MNSDFGPASVIPARQFVIPPRVFLFNTRGAFGEGGNLALLT